MKKILLLAATILISSQSLTAQFVPVVNRDQIQEELFAERIFKAELRDNRYVLPQTNFIKDQLLPYFVAYARQNLAAALDKPSLSIGLCQVFQSIAYQANIRGGGADLGDVPVGVMMTRKKGSTVLVHNVILRSSTGWYVINPSEGTMVTLQTFRDQHDIMRVII